MLFDLKLKANWKDTKGHKQTALMLIIKKISNAITATTPFLQSEHLFNPAFPQHVQGP
jgi:hypothetical protein